MTVTVDAHQDTHATPTRDRRVLVLNQYALPRSESGGTRHIDLFSRVIDWRTLIVAAGRNHYSQELFATTDNRFHLVRVPSYSANGFARILGWFIYAAKAALVGVSRRHVDVVYASSPQMLAPVAGWVIARLRRASLVVEVRDLWPESLVAAGKLRRGSRLHSWLATVEKWTMLRADHIVVVTAGWENHFAAMGVEPSAITVIPNGTEPSDFLVDGSREALRTSHSISGFTAIFAGAHGSKDGIDFILDAAAELQDVRFLLVGAGGAKAAAVARASNQTLSNVEFREPIPKSELPALLAACDVGIHTVAPLSVFALGMSPNKLFDYMTAGLPIVSNAGRALDRILVDGTCGRIGSANELVSCLRAVQAASPTDRKQWGKNGRDLVAANFSRSAAAASLRDVLALASSSRRATGARH